MKADLQEIEDLGRLQFSQSEISIIIDIEESKFTEPMIEARNKGRLMASSEVRKAILKQAISGSTPAQKQMMDLIEKAEPVPLTEKQLKLLESLKDVKP
jgi:hypothetical protein